MKILWVAAILALTGCVTSRASGPVLIIGDSISVGYTRYAQEAMPCISHAYSPHHSRNARDSSYLLGLLPTYFGDGKKYAVIQFNVGLWDIAHRIPDSGSEFVLGDVNKYPITTSPEDYRLNLQAIIDTLHSLQPQAMLIFATTTDVPADSLGRRPEDVDAYNRIAIQVMADNGIPIDDLHGWMESYPYLHNFNNPIKVHYTKAGYRLLAQKLVDTLSPLVSCDAIASVGM